MLQHSSAELAVCREAWELKIEFSPLFPAFLPTVRGRKGGRKEGKARKKREREPRYCQDVLVMAACALGHLLVMSACALGHLLSCLARAVPVVLRC